MKTLYVTGWAFSGSTILNAILNSQPTLRGMGEGRGVFAHHGEPGRCGPCASCESEVVDCGFWASVMTRMERDEHFYRAVAAEFQARGDEITTTLVDTSKGEKFLENVSREDSVNLRLAVITKSPHAQAYSFREQASNAEERARFSDIEATFRFLPSKWHKTKQWARRLGKSDPLVICYHCLCKNPAEVVRDVCAALGEPFDRAALTCDDWWQTDSHPIGGNPGAISLSSPSGEFQLAGFGGREGYLMGKYQGEDRRRSVFEDRDWAKDAEFCQQAAQAYQAMPETFWRSMRQLGFAKDKLVEEVEAAAEGVAIGAAIES